MSRKKKKKTNVNGQVTSNVHSALQYIISKALLEGKVGKTVLEIPMTDIFQEHEGPKFQPEAAALVLRLEIKTSWAEGSPEADIDIEDEGEIGFDELINKDDEEDLDEPN